MVFSQFANSKLKAGDVLEVGTPEGSLRSLEMQIAKKLRRLCIWKRNPPVLSILKSVLKSEPKVPLFWYTETKHLKTRFFINNYDLHLQYVNRLFVHYVYSQVKVESHFLDASISCEFCIE
jgi:ring-1,2-phenylacetyl-CoA epoxidase subunit PaaE